MPSIDIIHHGMGYCLSYPLLYHPTLLHKVPKYGTIKRDWPDLNGKVMSIWHKLKDRYEQKITQTGKVVGK